VSQICSLICLLFMTIILAPNSTPIVKSCTGWKRLSVNCKSKQDLPTPTVLLVIATALEGGGTCVANDDIFEEVSRAMAGGDPLWSGAYAYDIVVSQSKMRKVEGF